MIAHARRALLVALGCGAAVLGHARAAAADVVERVVAVVAHRPILLSEVERRARRDLIAKHEAVATQGELRAALETIIDERAMQRAAAVLHIAISPAEVERAIADRSNMLGVPPEELWTRTRASGYSDSEYREMVRMQLLDAKFSAIWSTRPVHPTPGEVWATYERLRHERAYQQVELDLVSVPVVSSPSATEALVRGLVERARAGEDWCTVARRAVGNQTCVRIRSFSSALVVAAARALEAVNEGGISEPIRIGDRAVVAFKLVRRVPPTFEELRGEAEMVAEYELSARMHRERLNDLRRQASVEIRW